MTVSDWTERLLDRSQPVTVRAEAAQTLARDFREYGVWQALCSVVGAEDEDPAVRCAVARALPDWNRSAAIGQLVRAYLNPEVRSAAVATLEDLGSVTGQDEIMLSACLKALRGSAGDDYVAQLLLWITGERKIAFSMEMAILRAGDDDQIRCFVANLPRRYGRDPRLLEYLNEELQGASPRRRAAAMAGLVMLGEAEAALRAVEDPSPAVRAELAEMLGAYREERGADVLARLLHDPDAEIAREAEKALRLLGRSEMPKPPAHTEASRHESAWGRLLREISRIRLSDREVAVEVPDEKVTAGWLGEQGATEEQIAAAERRLGVRLPPSYREFLTESNGFRQLNSSIWNLYGTSEIDWFRARNMSWIEAYEIGVDLSPEEHLRQRGNLGAFRHAYLSSCLQVSEEGDGAVILLNPKVVTAEGEWEAWFFADWLAGPAIHTSFRDLLEAELTQLRKAPSSSQSGMQ